MAIKPIKVSQLNRYIKRILQNDPILGNISVIGEISNLKFHGSGSVYFSLKDENSRINCFLSADNLRNIRYEPADGMEITAHGYMLFYERSGSCSLNIKDIEASGVGDLAIAFEKLKHRLAARGMFDENRKKPIPFFPKKVAVVTSGTGAAVRDILKIIQSRNNVTDILIYPVLVQGSAAACEIASAIEHINRDFQDVDVIITGRGGGSMEELWAFNEEIVAESIFKSKIPVISAVGHETDFTIADFAADKRAETPTAAAQIAVPDVQKIRESLSNTLESMKNSLAAQVKYKEMELQKNNIKSFGRILLQKINMLEMKAGLLRKSIEDLNPESIMMRGYAAISSGAGKMIKSVFELAENDRITITLSDGFVKAGVLEIRSNKYDRKEK